MWASIKPGLGRCSRLDSSQELAGQNGHESVRSRVLEFPPKKKCMEGQELARHSGPREVTHRCLAKLSEF